MFVKAIAMSGLATLASAHVLMTNPVPYGKSTLSNSPLLPDGSDFPCKLRGNTYAAEGASNVYAQGSKQQLAFQGSAVHGGGSCQVSVTTDLAPNKNSVWKVIKSIEGGCPAKNQVGNMGDNAGAAVPFKYDFDIPSELAAGNYTLAWTWFNKIGNREMYMNCAPLTVTGNAGSASFINGLPNMLVANIGNGCGTTEGTDVQFPNPGSNVDQFNGATTVFKGPTGNCAAATGGAGGPKSTPAGSSAQPTTTAAAQPTSSKPASSKPTTTKASIPGGVFITTTDSQPAPTQAPGSGNGSAPTLTTSVVPPASSAPSNPPSGGGSSPSGGYPAGTACTTDGQWNCIDGKAFQRCASGTWTPIQNMAAGVKCTAGESADLQMAAIQGKRAMRRALRMRA